MESALRTLRPMRAAVIAVALVLVVGCGADDRHAPRSVVATSDGSLQQCRGFRELMPAFVHAVDSGSTGNLSVFVKRTLAAPGRTGTPVMLELLRAVFATLTEFAKLPPERGAPAGQLCMVAAPGESLLRSSGLPSPSEAHPMCEVRRALDALVHEGQGLEALRLVDPLLAGLLNYIVGRDRTAPTQPVPPHYEAAQVISQMCQQNSTCRMDDLLDFLIGLTTFLETPEGTKAIGDLQRVVHSPEFEPFITNEGNAYGGEVGVVALADLVITIVMGMDDPGDLNQLPIDALPAGMRPDTRILVDDLRLLLSPTREPNVLRPMKRALNCYKSQDADRELVRMFYRLGLDEKLPAFGIVRIVDTVMALRKTDERGTLIHLVQTLAKSIRKDAGAADAAAQACFEIFDSRQVPGSSVSNARQVLPGFADVFQQGIATEAICAADTLLYGCAGGIQPACR